MKTTKSSRPEIQFAVVATDAACFRIEDKQLMVLIGKVGKHSSFTGRWALIGGVVMPEETTDQSVERLLKKRAGIGNIYKEQLYTFSDPERDTSGRVVSVAYLALAGKNPQTEKEISIETKWVQVKKMPNLAYDHNKILKYALERLRGKITYTNIAQHLLPAEFTLSELQNTYEVILGKELDKRNFRKKILSSHILKDTRKTRKRGVMRPAALYAFASQKQKIVELIK